MKAKLGMKIEGKRKSPYDALDRRMTEGRKEQSKLEKQGQRRLTRTGFEEEIGRSQRRLPKVGPAKKGRGGRA